jgi:hypothetical protein
MLETMKLIRKTYLRNNKPFRKWTAIILAFATLNLSGGCRNYFRINSSPRPSTDQVSLQADARKTIIIHFNDDKWLLSNVQVRNDTVKGRLDEYRMPALLTPLKPDKPNRYLTRPILNQRYLLNEVHLYLDEFSQKENNQVAIPVSAINRIDIYDKDTQSTVGSYFLGTVGIAAAAFLVIGVIVALTKESCPFIYTWDGTNYQFAGEIYSGSIHQPLERNDYLKLPSYPNQTSYTLKITNEVREIQHTNLLELLVVDHDDSTTVLADKNGIIHSLGQTLPPQRATSLNGADVTALVARKDSLFYQSNSNESELPLKDGIILEFPVQGNASTAKLAIHAKNSIVLDYMIGQFHDLFGSAYDAYTKKQQHVPEAKMRQWTLDQGIPLALYVERENKWEFVDYYHIAGPMKFKDDVLPIQLRGNETNPLKLKLEFGNYLWEIDYAAIDYSPDPETSASTLTAQTAINENHENITSLISGDDSKYYTQPTTENYAVLTFNLPPATAPNRTVILHSKGWYQILQAPKGKPDLEYLKAFRNPGRFNQFVNSRLIKMAEQVAR